MHNVVQGNQGFALVALELSNTSQTAGRLSFPKPPHQEHSFAVFPSLSDRIPSLEPGNGVSLDPFRDP